MWESAIPTWELAANREASLMDIRESLMDQWELAACKGESAFPPLDFGIFLDFMRNLKNLTRKFNDEVGRFSSQT